MAEIDGKRCLIYITGQIDHPFFYNEIDEIKKAFDEIYVIPYEEAAASVQKALNKTGVKLVHFRAKNNAGDIKRVVAFNSEKWVREEKEYIKNNIGKKMRAYAYLYYYLLFVARCIDVLGDLINDLYKKECKIYIYSFWASRGAVLASVMRMKIQGITKAITRAHRYDLYEERNSIFYLPFRSFVAKELDNILFISEDGLDYFQRLMRNRGTEYKKGNVIKLGTYGTDYKKVYKEKQKIVLASCSRIIEVKRLDLIIKLINCLSKNVDIHWIHIGVGDKKYEKEIHKLAESFIPGKFEFLGSIDNRKIIDIYKKYDVDWFINLSDSEGIPVSIMEAMSCGIPVVARDVGGNSEIVDKDNGILIGDISDDNFVNISKKIIEESLDETRYIMRSENAFVKWDKEYNSERNTKLFLDEFL